MAGTKIRQDVSEVERAIDHALELAAKGGPVGRESTSALRSALENKREIIGKLIGQGYSTTAIAKLFISAGVKGSVETIRKYIDGMGITASKAGKATQRKPGTKPTGTVTTPVKVQVKSAGTKKVESESADSDFVKELTADDAGTI